MKNKLASIIVITHNRLFYTRLCLDSIFRATGYRPYEVIVVDNASNDGTVAYLQDLEFRGKIQQAVFLEQNYGAGYALNQGIARARGTYLIRSDNDMVYNHGWLTALVRALERIPQAVLQVAVFGELVAAGRTGGFSRDSQINGVVLNQVLIGGCNMAFTRETYEELGPFCHDRFAEDGLFCFTAQQKGYIIGQINDATGTHIDHPACSLSRRYTEYAGYRMEILQTLRNAGVDFWCEEDRRFYAEQTSGEE